MVTLKVGGVATGDLGLDDGVTVGGRTDAAGREKSDAHAKA
jgi:hypothetical protein